MRERSDPHSQIVAFWCDRFEHRVGERYPFASGKDGATIKRLRGIYDDDKVRTLIAAFFEMDDPFFEQAGYSLGCFASCLPKVLMHLKKQAEPKASDHPLSNIADYLQRRSHG